MDRIIESLTSRPAEIFKLSKVGGLKKGYYADVVVIDPKAKWKVEQHKFLSKSSNTPLLDTNMNGKILITIYDGKVIYKDENYNV